MRTGFAVSHPLVLERRPFRLVVRIDALDRGIVLQGRFTFDVDGFLLDQAAGFVGLF
jgi:hypothetical protein